MLYRLTVEIDAFLDYDLTFEEEVRTTVVASADVHIKKLEYKHMMKAVEQLMKAFNARSRALSCELVREDGMKVATYVHRQGGKVTSCLGVSVANIKYTPLTLCDKNGNTENLLIPDDFKEEEEKTA